MLKSLILFALAFNIAFAKERFSEADKRRFLDEVKQGVAEHKAENKGRVDLQIIKPGFYQELEESLKQRKFTRDEMQRMKQRYEAFSKDPRIKPNRAEAEFYNFIQRELDFINSQPLEKIKEGYICNNWSCEDGFTCAPDPVQEAIGKRKKAGAACSDNNECSSGDCVEESIGSQRKICEDVYRCYRPLTVGESCTQNPVCGQGSCLPFNSETAGIGECEVQGNTCKKDSDCCSGSCNGGTCKANMICKDCVSNGSKPQRGQRCCEGLYLNRKGVCAPDVPPSVIPQVRMKPTKNVFISFVMSMIISTADANTGATGQTGSNPFAGVQGSGTPAATSANGASATQTGTTKPLAATEEEEDEETDQRTDEEKKADEAAFLAKGAKDDGLDVKSGIMVDREKYKDFKPKSLKGKELDMNEKKPKLKFERKSDFATCKIEFKDDFYNALKEDGALDLEVAMLGFDFAVTGESDPDHWRESTSPESSVYSRLKKVGVAHKKLRKETNKKIAEIERKLKCMCLDVQGYKKITDAENKSFFEQKCPDEYAVATDPTTPTDELEGDASGLKAKRLLVTWTENLAEFHADLAVDNSEAYQELSKIQEWVASAEWDEGRHRTYDLFKFNIKNPSGSVAALGGLVGALLAAGIIAVLGGFATTSLLTAWAAAGIISASAVTGAGGLWVMASLKGAWISHRPEISDNVTAPRGYSCGKKETCTEYTRTLLQPYNETCKAHTSANACVNNFVVINDEGESRYIVDPWIPAGVRKDAILMGQPNYVESLDKAFLDAKAEMLTKNPGASGGGGKKGGGEFVTEDYLSEVFIDAKITGKYAPALNQNLEATYFMSNDKAKLIKDAAKEFAVKEGFLRKEDTKNLDQFADYAYEYHFLWPKKSRPGEISYPTVGLTTYLQFMAQDVSGNITTGLAGTAAGLNQLNEQYVRDYLENLELYVKKPINQNNPVKLASLNKEIERVKKKLDNLVAMNAMIGNSGLDTKLTSLSTGFLADQSRLAGANGASLSDSQKNFLKAVGGLRTARKEQLKALDTYNKAMANGDRDRASKMSSAAKKFSSSFAKGALPFNGSGSGYGNSLFSGTSSDDGSSDSLIGGQGFGSGSNSGTDDYGAGLGAGSLYGTGGLNNGKSSTTTGPSVSGGRAGYGSYADQKKLQEAIDARNRASKEKYLSKDGQTLFEKVTNAYIRNYDKVLIKKKDKDVIEENK